MPDFLKGAEIGGRHSGVLQRVNRLATRTSEGCPCACDYCSVPRIEGKFVEMATFRPGPVVCDNNLLAASMPHLERVAEMLRGFGWADLQGIDSGFVTPEKIALMETAGRPIYRMSVDTAQDKAKWERAFEIMRGEGVAKHRIRTYALIGFRTDPAEAWERCEWVEAHVGTIVSPMWYHPPDAMVRDEITKDQEELGWSKKDQKRIMDYYYQHRGSVLREREPEPPPRIYSPRLRR